MRVFALLISFSTMDIEESISLSESGLLLRTNEGHLFVFVVDREERVVDVS